MCALSCDRVGRHFDREAARFDRIYRRDKGRVERAVDALFRGVVHRRFQLTLERCGDVNGLRVLDVGCGSGRYAVEFARRGAQVVGLDIAPAMLVLAEAAAAAAGVQDRCTFLQVDLLAWTAPEPFDLGLAMGFFDYTSAPQRHLARLAAFVQGRIMCSFPRLWTLRTLPRWMRLRLRGCPVHFYTRRHVDTLFSTPPWHEFRVDRLSRDFLVEARNRGAAGGATEDRTPR